MYRDLSQYLLAFPGSSRFVRSIADELSEGRSVFVDIPLFQNIEALSDRIHRACRTHDRYYFEISVAEKEPRSPLEMIAKTANIALSSAPSFHGVLRRIREQGIDGFIITGSSDASRLSAWLATLSRWAIEAKAVFNAGILPPTLCLISPSPDENKTVFSSDPWLTRVSWWGVINATEISAYCSELLHDRLGLSHSWSVSLISSIALDDPALISLLASDRTWVTIPGGSISELLLILKRHAEQRGWRPGQPWTSQALDILNSHSKYLYSEGCKHFPAEIRNLWFEGLASYVSSEGILLHSAACSVLGNRGEQILLYRIWRGQLRYAYPWLEAIRLEICNKAENMHGPDWVESFRNAHPVSADGIETEAKACDWGELSIMNRERWLFPGENSHRFSLLLRQGRHIRNCLAHYRPISFEDFRSFLSSYSGYQV